METMEPVPSLEPTSSGLINGDRSLISPGMESTQIKEEPEVDAEYGLQDHTKIEAEEEEEGSVNSDLLNANYTPKEDWANFLNYVMDSPSPGKTIKRGSKSNKEDDTNYSPQTEKGGGSGKKKYTCQECGKSFATKFYLSRHNYIHTGERPFACEQCDATFTQSAHLKRHLIMHTGELPHTCNICGKQFSLETNMRQHMFVHTDERPHHCEYCPLTFKTAHYLNKHRLVHTGQKQYPCEHCGATFTQLVNLRSHVGLHTGERPFKCTECEKDFTGRASLRQHLLTHIDEKPFTCEYCPAKFRRAGDMKKHIQTHTGEKPYSCDLCNKRFIWSNDLRRHAKTHLGAQPFSCSLCGVGFCKKNQLQNHVCATESPMDNRDLISSSQINIGSETDLALSLGYNGESAISKAVATAIAQEQCFNKSKEISKIGDKDSGKSKCKMKLAKDSLGKHRMGKDAIESVIKSAINSAKAIKSVMDGARAVMRNQDEPLRSFEIFIPPPNLKYVKVNATSNNNAIADETPSKNHSDKAFIPLPKVYVSKRNLGNEKSETSSIEQDLDDESFQPKKKHKHNSADGDSLGDETNQAMNSSTDNDNDSSDTEYSLTNTEESEKSQDNTMNINTLAESTYDNSVTLDANR